MAVVQVLKITGALNETAEMFNIRNLFWNSSLLLCRPTRALFVKLIRLFPCPKDRVDDPSRLPASRLKAEQIDDREIYVTLKSLRAL